MDWEDELNKRIIKTDYYVSVFLQKSPTPKMTNSREILPSTSGIGFA